MRNIGQRFEHFIFDLFSSFELDSKLISQPLDKGVDIEIIHNSGKYGVEAKKSVGYSSHVNRII